MRLVVLDTNVIVSARVSRTGIPAKLLDDWVLAGEVQTITSPAVVREYREVTSRPNSHVMDSHPPGWISSLPKASNLKTSTRGLTNFRTLTTFPSSPWRIVQEHGSSPEI